MSPTTQITNSLEVLTIHANVPLPHYKRFCNNFITTTMLNFRVFHARLLYPNSIKWITGDGTYTYPFESSFPDTLYFLIPTIHQKMQYAVVTKLNLIDQVVGLL